MVFKWTPFFIVDIYIKNISMKKIIITENQYKFLEKKYTIVEQSENEKLFKKFIDMVSKESSKNKPKSKGSENLDTTIKTSEKLYSPLKNVKFPKNNFGVNRPGLDKPGKSHPGIDLSAASGTEVYSPQNGVVIDSAIRNDGCGGTLYIDHQNGFKSRYCHLKQIFVQKGDKVEVGEKVALSGGGKNDNGHGFSTGPHLHFEVYLDGKLVNPSQYVKEKMYDEDSDDLV
jgi:murein DD-endopeptidase MepM/ murein hydrolase activator NlpD